MRPTVIGLTVLMVGMCSVVNVAQTLRPRPPGGTQQNRDLAAEQVERKSVHDVPIVMPMIVEAGTPIKVAIDNAGARRSRDGVRGRDGVLSSFLGASRVAIRPIRRFFLQLT